MILVGSVISSLVNLRPLSEATDEFFWYISGNADGGVGAWMQSVSANDVSCTIIKENKVQHIHMGAFTYYVSTLGGGVKKFPKYAAIIV